MPAKTAFCTISNDVRPLTHSRWFDNGSASLNSMRPTILSTALCRPTSSARSTSSPDRVNSPAAWRPPVSSNTAWRALSRSGNIATVDAAIVHADRIGSLSEASDSIVSRPQRPQEEFPVT